MMLKHASNVDAVVRIIQELGLRFSIDDADSADYHSLTPLHRAVILGQRQELGGLINKDTLNCQDRQGRTALIYAVELGDLISIKTLTKEKAMIDLSLSETSGRGYTALHVAARNGHSEIISLVVDPLNINAPSLEKGFTPLHLAARYLNWECIPLLISKGASVHAKDYEGNTVLHLIAKYMNNETGLFDELLKLIVSESGGNLNETDHFKRTPLHVAVQNGRHHLVTRLLAQEGIKINEVDSQGRTCLHYSALYMHPLQFEHPKKKSIVQILLDGGANPTIKDDKGDTPWSLISELIDSHTWMPKEEASLIEERKRLKPV